MKISSKTIRDDIVRFMRKVPPLYRLAKYIMTIISPPRKNNDDHLQQDDLNEKSIYLKYVPPGHYYSPLPNLDDLLKDHERIFSRDIRELPGLEISIDRMLKLLSSFQPFSSEFPYDEDQPGTDLRFHFNNGTYEGDACILYSMIRVFNPSQIIEVGSGMTTCLILDINRVHYANRLFITSIDPYPDALLNRLQPKDLDRIKILPTRLQDVDVNIFTNLIANDMLIIDSSHVSKCDSDVNHIFFNILPLLKPGVLIHFHDVFYPFEYPQEWLLKTGAAWNENYILRAFLEYNQEFEIVFFCDLLNQAYRQQLIEIMPHYAHGYCSSFWMRRKEF